MAVRPEELSLSNRTYGDPTFYAVLHNEAQSKSARRDTPLVRQAPVVPLLETQTPNPVPRVVFAASDLAALPPGERKKIELAQAHADLTAAQTVVQQLSPLTPSQASGQGNKEARAIAYQHFRELSQGIGALKLLMDHGLLTDDEFHRQIKELLHTRDKLRIRASDKKAQLRVVGKGKERKTPTQEVPVFDRNNEKREEKKRRITELQRQLSEVWDQKKNGQLTSKEYTRRHKELAAQLREAQGKK